MLTHRLLGGVLVLMVVGGLTSSCGGGSSSVPPTPDKAAVAIADKAKTDAADADAWHYGEVKSEMTGTVSKWATKQSVNTVNFGFPYNGEQHGTVMVDMDDSSDTTMLFYVKKGQIVCNGLDKFGTCLVFVKFDDSKADFVTAHTSGDDSTTIGFDTAFLRRLRRSKKLLIQVEVFHEGAPIFTFDVGGLNQVPTKH